MKKILTGIALGIVTRHAYEVLNNYLKRSQLVYDIAMLEIASDRININALLCNYSGSSSVITLKEIQLYDGDNKILSQSLNYGTIRLMNSERIMFKNITVPLKSTIVSHRISFKLLAQVDHEIKELKPFQSINNRAIYDSERAQLYTQVIS